MFCNLSIRTRQQIDLLLSAKHCNNFSHVLQQKQQLCSISDLTRSVTTAPTALASLFRFHQLAGTHIHTGPCHSTDCLLTDRHKLRPRTLICHVIPYRKFSVLLFYLNSKFVYFCISYIHFSRQILLCDLIRIWNSFYIFSVITFTVLTQSQFSFSQELTAQQVLQGEQKSITTIYNLYRRTQEHSLFLDFITVLRHVSVIQGDHNQVRIYNYKGKEVLRRRHPLLHENINYFTIP